MSPSPIFRLRLSDEERAQWQSSADRAGLDLSAYVRRCVREAIQLERAVARADRLAERRAQRLGRLTPDQIDALRRRGGDWGSWPELDDPGG